jgi:septal ring-binding cell division protein DamX
MITRSTLLTAFATILFSGSLLAQVAVTTKLPATAAPGSSFTMELDIAKGDVSGFAKLQQILPPGFTAEAGESANATFSFKDQKVKFLWMALPNGDFKVSYKINVDASLSGNQIIEGSFAYIKDNETEKFIIPKDIIAIQANQAEAAQQAAMDKILADQQAKEAAAEAAREEAAPAEEVVEAEPVVEEVAEEVAEVVEEVAEVVEESVEEVAEQVEEVVEEVADAEPTPTPAPKPTPAPEPTPAPKPIAEPTPASDYNDAMLKSKPGLVFRVQIAAGPNQVDPSFFQQKYGLNEAVVIEEHEGLKKYVVGEFGSYRPAKTFSNELRDNSGVEGPFVTAYNDGVRIHVKEALEIAGQ